MYIIVNRHGLFNNTSKLNNEYAQVCGYLYLLSIQVLSYSASRNFLITHAEI